MLQLSHPLWRAAHLTLFLCAGLAALLAPAVWLWPGGLGADPLRWHLHELLFGMGGAAVGGYLLTALPSWTGAAGRVGPQGGRALALLWLLARLSLPFAESLPVGPDPYSKADRGTGLAAAVAGRCPCRAGAGRCSPVGRYAWVARYGVRPLGYGPAVCGSDQHHRWARHSRLHPQLAANHGTRPELS